MEQKVNIKYIIKCMLKASLAAVVFGLLCSMLYLNVNKRNENNRTTNNGSERNEKISLIYQEYKGNYLDYPEASRNLVYKYRFNKEQWDFSSGSNTLPVDYSNNFGTLMVERLKSGSMSNMFYQRLMEEYPELKADQNVFTIIQFENSVLSINVDHKSVFWIMVKAPLFLKTEETVNKYTDKQLCDYRDSVTQYIEEYMETDDLYYDLPIALERVDHLVEKSVSEQNLIMYEMDSNNHSSKLLHTTTLSKKRLLLVGLIGFTFVEALVFLYAIFNDRIKDYDDLTNNTNLDALNYDLRGKLALDWEMISIKIADLMKLDDKLFFISDGPLLRTEEFVEKYNTSEKKIEVVDLNTFVLSSDDLKRLSGQKAVLIIQEDKTTYGKLRTLSTNLSQLHTNVLGCILVTKKMIKENQNSNFKGDVKA